MTLDPCIVDSDTIDLSMVGSSLQAVVRVSPDADNGLEQRTNGLWVGGRGYGASFPPAGTEHNGQIYFITAAPGVTWQYRYNLDSGLANKWEFIGGADLFSAVETVTTLTPGASPAGAWVNGDATPGPDIAVPLTGLYDVWWEVTAENDTGTGASEHMSFGVAVGIGSDPASDLIAAADSVGSSNGTHLVASQRKQFSAGQILRIRYKNTVPSSTGTFKERRLRIRPVNE
jgi:hypothetical protein